MAQIIVENLTKSFEAEVKGTEKLVLKGVNASFEEKEISVILGRSGVGKTVLLRIMAGLLSPTSGKVTFSDGLKAGFVFQEARLMPWLNVWDNVNFGLEISQIDRQKTQDIIDLVALTGHEASFPSDLSGGMAHRVALARMLISRPKLIFMDEPFSALDYFTRAMLQRNAKNISLISTSMSFADATKFSENINVRTKHSIAIFFSIFINPPWNIFMLILWTYIFWNQ